MAPRHRPSFPIPPPPLYPTHPDPSPPLVSHIASAPIPSPGGIRRSPLPSSRSHPQLSPPPQPKPSPSHLDLLSPPSSAEEKEEPEAEAVAQKEETAVEGEKAALAAVVVVDKDVALWGVPLLPSKGDEAMNVVLLKFLHTRIQGGRRLRDAPPHAPMAPGVEEPGRHHPGSVASLLQVTNLCGSPGPAKKDLHAAM